MLNLKLEKSKTNDMKILCLGAHSDDIEIGCGGTILQLLKKKNNIYVYWVVFSANEKRKKEALASAKTFLKNARSKTVVINDFRDGYFPYIGAEIKDYFEALKKSYSPDLIFTPCRNDLHQDHRLISELTWNTFRDHLILEYEIAKYDGDLGSPNIFVSLDEKICQKKCIHIMDAFKSQSTNHWFAEETFTSLMRIRGIESNSPSKYAEGFYGRKIVLE
jgi:LmbE family N-acetylglucosaminyl deacetylase